MLQTTNPPLVTEWLNRIRAEFLEVPGLRLSRNQVQRFWGLDTAMCDALLGALEDSRFLRRTRDDLYVRADSN